jgi:hypothetical protein
MSKGRMVLMGGMGYPLTELPAGMPTFKTKLEAIGLEVLLISWKQRQDAYNFMREYTGWRGYAGDSLGAGSAGTYPMDVKGDVEFAGGFQPSMYDARSHDEVITVASNLKLAHAIYNPSWIETGGLGISEYRPAPHARTVVINTKHYGPHPDDWSVTQSWMLAWIKSDLEKK